MKPFSMLLALTMFCAILITSFTSNAETPEEFYARIKNLRKTEKKPEEAAQEALAFLQNHPEKDMIRQKIMYEYAACFFQQEKFDDAKTAFLSIVTDYADTTLDKASADFMVDDSLYFASMIEQNHGDKTKAIDSYAALVKDFPKSNWRPNVLMTLGNMKQDEKKYEECIVYYDQLIKDYPDNELSAQALYWTNRALIHWDNTGVVFEYKREGEPINKETEIKKNLDTLLEKYRDSKITADAWYDAFNYYTNRGELDKVEEIGKTILDKYPNWPNIKRLMVDYFGTVCSPGRNKFAPTAIEKLDEIIVEAEANKDSELFEVATLCKATCFADLKKFDDSRAVLSAFIKEHAESKIFRDFQVEYADTYYQERNLARAIEEYKKILEDMNETEYWGPNLCFMIAASYRESGKNKEAIEWYEKTISDYPESSWAAVAGRDLYSLKEIIKLKESKEENN